MSGKHELPDNLRELAEHRAVGKGGHSFAQEFDEMTHVVAHVPPRGAGPDKTIEEILAAAQQKHRDSMVRVTYAGHPIMPSAVEEICVAREWRATRGASVLCGEHATHKLGEEGGDSFGQHNLTAYVCCEHFRAVMGRCA